MSSSSKDYSLDEISNEFVNLLENKIVHFGSCKTLFIEEESVRKFLNKTSAIAISGYAKNIDFISSAVFDVFIF
ncbi:MAG: DUF6642 family protein [Flavobacterium sp.]